MFNKMGPDKGVSAKTHTSGPRRNMVDTLHEQRWIRVQMPERKKVRLKEMSLPRRKGSRARFKGNYNDKHDRRGDEKSECLVMIYEPTT